MSAALPSPRTPEEPMAFTRNEFWRGARLSVGIFLGLILLLTVIGSVVLDLTPLAPNTARASNIALLPIVLPVTALVAAPVSLIVMFLAHPLFHGIGRALRREPRVLVHLLVQALSGALVGAVVMGGVYFALFAFQQIQVAAGAVVIMASAGAAFTGVSVPAGWYLAYRRARQDDRLRARAGLTT